MDFELDLDSSFDWGFKAVSSDEVEQGKQQSEAINKVVNLRYFTLSATVYGKYKDYEEDFDYDFTEEIRDILKDQLGFKLILIGDKQ